MLSDFGTKLSLGNRRVVKPVEAPRREDSDWDPITNNTAPATRYGKKISGLTSNPPVQNATNTTAEPTVASMSAPDSPDAFRTGRKMIPQPAKEQPIAPPTGASASPEAYSKTARMKYSRRYEGNNNVIVGENWATNSTLRTGRGAVQGVFQTSGNILTGEGVAPEPIRRKQFIGGYSAGTAGERPWALHYEGNSGSTQ